MAESQSHGVMFEDTVIRAITGTDKISYEKMIKNGYTSAFDIHESVLSDFNGSIKTAKGDSIGCGDIVRFLSHCQQAPFTMIVGKWVQSSKTKKKYIEILEFDFTPDKYYELFGDLTPEIIRPFVEWVKSIPSGKEAQLKSRPIYKERRANIKSKYNCGLASIDVKIDSKTQRRVQIGLKISDLVKSSVPTRTYTLNYRGINLPYEQNSQARVFKRS